MSWYPGVLVSRVSWCLVCPGVWCGAQGLPARWRSLSISTHNKIYLYLNYRAGLRTLRALLGAFVLLALLEHRENSIKLEESARACSEALVALEIAAQACSEPPLALEIAAPGLLGAVSGARSRCSGLLGGACGGRNRRPGVTWSRLSARNHRSAATWGRLSARNHCSGVASSRPSD